MTTPKRRSRPGASVLFAQPERRSLTPSSVQRYLDAAFELIDEKGTTDFTIQEVIDRSKQSLRGFYQYFDGKDELLLALFEETVRESVDDLENVIDAESEPLARLRASPSVCTSGATRPMHPATVPQSPSDLRVLGPARCDPSRPGDGRDGSRLGDAARPARGGRRRGVIKSSDPRRGAPPSSRP